MSHDVLATFYLDSYFILLDAFYSFLRKVSMRFALIKSKLAYATCIYFKCTLCIQAYFQSHLICTTFLFIPFLSHGTNFIFYIQAKALKLLTYLIHQLQHASGTSPSSGIFVLTIGPPLTL